jgi:hypothetical protein
MYTGAALFFGGLLLLSLLNFMPVPEGTPLGVAGIYVLLEYPVHSLTSGFFMLLGGLIWWVGAE